MSVKNNFGRFLKSLRTKCDRVWTQETIAKELNFARRTYIGWENGENIPYPEYLKQIVILFNLNDEDEDALYRAAAQAAPRVHNIPFLQNPFFTGREALLKRLGQYLQENGSVALTPPVIISGLGGMGKTQLALEYAHKSYRDIYRAVFWVNAVDKNSIEHDYVSLAQLLDLPERHKDGVEQPIQAVKRWLDGHTQWLLIMDNADDLQLARPYLPIKPGGHILLTTRSQIVGTLGRCIDLEVMGLAEGSLFLLRRSGLVKDDTDIATIASDIRETAARLVIILGGLPLALDQAGAYIEETGVSFADYIKLYEEARHFLLNRRGSSGSTYGDHPESVAATLELCFRKACEEHPAAEGILYFCSWVWFSLPIPERFFQTYINLDLDKKTLNEVIAILRRYSLVKRYSQLEGIWSQLEGIWIHPLVRVILRDAISPDAKKYWDDRMFPGVVHTNRPYKESTRLPFGRKYENT